MYHLDELDIEDRARAIIEINKVLTKSNLMLNLERKCQSMQAHIYKLMKKFGILREEGLPRPMVIHEKLMSQEDYVDRLNESSNYQASTSGVKALGIGNVLYDNLENPFFLENEVKHLFINKPIFSKYTEADKIY